MGGFDPSGMSTGRRHSEAQGNSDLCGGRLKELFEKSSLRNLKNFPADVFFLSKISEHSEEILL